MLSNIFCLSNAENMAKVILKGFELLNVNSNFVRKYSLQLHLYKTAVNSRSDEAFSNWLKCVQYRSPSCKI